MNKKILVLVSFVILIVLGGGVFWYMKMDRAEVEEIHIHAAFQMYSNNQLVDFSTDRYMHIKPCGEEDESNMTDEEFERHEIEERAHLHDNVGDVVHVHRENATWGDLFTNLRYQIDGNIAGYVNGKLVDNILDEKINAYDSIVIFVGENSDIDNKIVSAPNADYVKEAEKKTEGC